MSKNHSCLQRGLVPQPLYLQFFMTDMWRSLLVRRLGLATVSQPRFERALADSNASKSSTESFYRQLSNQVRPADCLDRAGNVVRRLLHREESIHHLILVVD